MTHTPLNTEQAPFLELEQYAERAYLEYAMSVVKGRALPDVCDGEKPVQRRILYAMKEMGLTHGAKPVKSARVVGEILGKYHPHGDSSAYEALVRMAQDFTLRYPLIDGQGNFGSRDGDSAAAMRYTEARLTPFADLLLNEIDMGTVDFVPNYDGAFIEPALLPARLPILLLNGASGIAVGMATEIPPHNLSEVGAACIALLDDPSLTTTQLMQFIQGPDFPGGGQIITPYADILSAYETGKGSVRIRAKTEIDELARGQWRVIVTELPPNSSAQKILAEIEEASNPKIKTGKKTLSLEQQNLKTLMLSLLDRVRDESDGEHPVRLVFEPKSSRQNKAAFINTLLAQTSLENNTSLNLVMIGQDGRPAQKGLKNILSEWLNFRTQTVTRRLQHRLGQVDKRMHILEGRAIVFLHIDEVIRVIRESDDPKPELMATFGLSDSQAEDILEIRLRQLARLEGIKLEKELSELNEERLGLQHLLDTPRALKRLIRNEIRADTKKYGDVRRTEIKEAERAILKQTIPDEAITLILSNKGWLRARSGHGLDVSNTVFKEGDGLKEVIETRNIWPLVVLDTLGRCYGLSAADIPTGRGDGAPLSSLINFQQEGQLAYVLANKPDARFMMAGSGGYGFMANLADMNSRIKTGKVFITLEAGETLLPPCPVAANLVPEKIAFLCATDTGRVLCFPLSELKTLSKGRGLMLMQLSKGERLCAMALLTMETTIVPNSDGSNSQHITALQTIKAKGITVRGRIFEDKIDALSFIGKRGKRGKPAMISGVIRTFLVS